MRLAAPLVALLVAAPVPVAAGDEITEFKSQATTAKDRAWLRGVSRGLKLSSRGRVWRASFVWRAPKSYGSKLKVQALQLKLAGVDARRLWLESEAAALEYAGRVTAKRAKAYVLIEVRGKQVVIVSGAKVQQHLEAGQALKALWATFPAPKKAALLAVRYDAEHFAAKTIARGPFHQSAVRAFTAARAMKAGAKLRATWKSATTVHVSGPDLTAFVTVKKGSSRSAVGVGKDHAMRSFRVDEFLTALEYFAKAGVPTSRPASRPAPRLRRRAPRRIR